jgi:hypothetical protein
MMIKIDDHVAYVPAQTTTEVINNALTRRKMEAAGVAIEDVPLPSEQVKHKMDRGLRKIVARFSEAYKKVYGCPPVVTYDKPWLKVSGVDNRISRQRLLEMAKQLEYRAG